MKGYIKDAIIFLGLVCIFTIIILRTQLIPVQAIKNQFAKSNTGMSQTVLTSPYLPSPTPIADPMILSIPTIGVNAHIEAVGLDSEGRMDVPTNWWNVAWYKLGPKPGERGNVVIDGHLDSPTGPAVFWHLKDLTFGDEIIVTNTIGKEYTYEVKDIESYNYNRVPMQQVFGSTDSYNLNLITCTGVFDRTSKNYSERQVVYATLVR